MDGLTTKVGQKVVDLKAHSWLHGAERCSAPLLNLSRMISLSAISSAISFQKRIFMTLALCKTALLDLIKDQENRVIALSGKWGTGKTHLWQRVREETDDAQAKAAVSASLFGVSTIVELKLKIAQGIAPTLGKTSSEGLMGWLAGITKVMKGVHSSFSALEEFALLAMPFMLKDRFIIIDDIERKHTKLTIDEILGFIDECVLNHGCRILLILNSDKLKDQDIWSQIREKVVDQELKLETSTSEAFDIAHKLTSCPWPTQLRAALEPLQITNIRVIRKIIRAANQLLGQDPHLAPLVLKRVLPSISLLGAIHYGAVEDAPSNEFILGFQSHKAFTLLAHTGQQGTPLSQEQQDHQRWYSLMSRMGIRSTDELEAMILAFFNSGIMDSAKIQHLVSKHLQKSERLEARNKAITFEEHLAWHPQLSENDLILELEALLPSAGLLDMKRVSNLVPSIDRLTGNQKLGLAFVEKWCAQFKAGFSDADIEDWLEFHGHSPDQVHPMILDEIDRVRTASMRRFTVIELFQNVVKGGEWGSSEMKFLRSTTSQMLEQEIRAAAGSDLQLLVQKGFALVNDTNIPEGNYGDAPLAFLQACRTIIEQEPESRLSEILQREARIAGVELKLEPAGVHLIQG
ncbi:P-loop NTPase fold protein [Pseudomonas putida]|uniref:P-loop NTPase fold protein n=1 Tax=Pseudomonas putida TaxID=303 RepID=UPI000E0CCADE|nr:P-loop NTPase fold protein [Pseudomonas putida]WQE52220.1 P-loop NTPase fold protein [Pseudomonas putida]HDS1005720.1 hypothetical protein [Pseudomonas putida]